MKTNNSFVSESDSKQFCKPTNVAILNNGSAIYVADGHYNSHIVKFDSNEDYLNEYKMSVTEQPLTIPHSIILIELVALFCVVDRENGR